MNILHLEASSGWGGQEIRILSEAEGMRKRGHTLFFAVMPGAILGKKAKEAGFLVYECNFHRSSWPVTLLKLLFLLVKYKIDLINTHSSLDAWIGGIAGRILRKKIVRTRHLSTPVKAGFNSRFVYGTLADFVITTCQSIIPLLSKQSGKPTELFCSIATGVNPEKLSATEEQAAAFRQQLGLSGQDFLIGTACFMRSWKGIEDFLQAASQLRMIKWIIIGGGHSERYKKLASDLGLESIVFFADHLENPFPAIKAFDVFALLSTANEGVSQAILQAAFFEKPLIATNTGGLGEVCIDQVTGIQVPCFSPSAVASAALKMRESRELRNKFGLAAKKHVLTQFTFQHTLDQTEAIYKKLLQTKENSMEIIEQGRKEKALQFYLIHRTKLLFYFGAFCLLMVSLISYLSQDSSPRHTTIAREAFEQWKKSPTDEKNWTKLNKCLKKTPHLTKEIKGEIAQTLLEAGLLSSSEVIAKECIQTLQEYSPLHALFAEGSLLVEKKNYQNALEKAVSLKEKIEQSTSKETFAVLHAYNLLRVAFLQKQLSNAPGELAAWEEVKGLLEKEEYAETVAPLLEANFQKQQGKKIFSLDDFISQREQSLMKP